MNDDCTIFKFRGGYIPLVNLEDLHSRNAIAPDEFIYFTEYPNSCFSRYDLSTFEDIYGTERPFQLRLKEKGSNEERGWKRLITDDVKEGVRRIMEECEEQYEKSVKQEHLRNPEQFDYVDWPLFNVDAVPETDSVTGEKVFQEMEKLKTLLPLRNWEMAETTKFFYLNRRFNEVAICRLCKFTPYSPFLFFKHLFSQQHCNALSKCVVPQQDFNFWTEKITGTKYQEPIKEDKDGRFPLLANSDDPQVSIILTFEQFVRIMSLYGEVDARDFARGGCYFFRFMRSIRMPHYCSICRQNLVRQPLRIAEHIFLSEHMLKLRERGVDRREYNIWVNIMTVELNLKKRQMRNTATTTRIFENQNSPPIDLIDFDVKSTLVPEEQRTEKLEALQKLWSKVELKDLSMSCGPRVTCYACNIPKDHYGTQIIEHIFTEEHMQFLIDYGFTEEALQSVTNQLQKYIEKREKKQSEKVSSSRDQKRTSQEKTTKSSPKVCGSNSPRVPLLDLLPPDVTTTSQKVYVTAMKNIKDQFTKAGKPVADKLKETVVDWNCGYCSTQKKKFELRTQLDAIEHILNQKHKEKMKFQSSKADLIHWEEWAKNLSKGNGGGSDLPVQKVPPKPEQTVPTISATQNAGSFKNSPRVPMLDAHHTALQTVSHNILIKKMQWINDTSNWHSFANNTKQIKVDWKCSLCSTVEQPVVLSNKYDAIRHIVSRNHRLLMKSTSVEDLKFWEDWVNGIIRKVQRDGKPEPERESTVASSRAKSSSGTPANDSVKKVSRVPLLDPVCPDHKIADRETVMETLNRFNQWSGLNDFLEIAEQVKGQWKCSFCVAVRTLENNHQVIRHIVSNGHRKNMGVVSREDLKFWDDWAAGIHKRVLEQQEKKREEVRKRPTNIPRIELLDIPNSDQPVLPYKVSMARYNVLKRKTYALRPEMFQETIGDSKCFHCPNSEKMITFWDVLMHVFDREHIKNIMSIATEDDFNMWEQLIKSKTSQAVSPPVAPVHVPANSIPTVTLPVPAPPAPSCEVLDQSDPLSRKSPPPSPPAPPRVRPILPQECTLPLFFTQRVDGRERSGPTILQLKQFHNFSTKPNASVKCFVNPTFCKCCRLNMTYWDSLHVMEHAITVDHLRKAFLSGVNIFQEDFDYWISRVTTHNPAEFTNLSVTLDPSENSAIVNVKWKRPIPDTYSEIFTGFTPEEKAVLASFDVEKLDQKTRNTLLREYGACFECNCWIRNSNGIIPHYTSEQHLKNIKESGRPIRRHDVDVFIEHAKSVSKKACILM